MTTRLIDKPTHKSFLLVSYDISSNKRRLKIMKTLEDHGKRVQYSESFFPSFLPTRRSPSLSAYTSHAAAEWNGGSGHRFSSRPREK